MHFFPSEYAMLLVALVHSTYLEYSIHSFSYGYKITFQPREASHVSHPKLSPIPNLNKLRHVHKHHMILLPYRAPKISYSQATKLVLSLGGLNFSQFVMHHLVFSYSHFLWHVLLACELTFLKHRVPKCASHCRSSHERYQSHTSCTTLKDMNALKCLLQEQPSSFFPTDW